MHHSPETFRCVVIKKNNGRSTEFNLSCILIGLRRFNKQYNTHTT